MSLVAASVFVCFLQTPDNWGEKLFRKTKEI
jgi:hypothetical protein